MKKISRFWLIFLIFLNGYISLSLELLVLRQLSFYVGSSAVVTSIIMGTFLGFMSWGYFCGSSKRINDNKIRKILGFSFMTIALLTLVAATFPFITKYFQWMNDINMGYNVIQTFLYSLTFLSVGPFLFGFNTTLLSRCMNTYNTSYTGNIMAWDTIGSVVGSLATTLILMPFIGVNYTVIAIVALSLFAMLLMVSRCYMWIAGLIILGITVFINSNAYQLKHFGIFINNANSTISVSEQGNVRMLNMNGLPMSIYSKKHNSSAPYVNYINENFIDTLPNDRRYNILVLGAGGFTVGINDVFNDYTFVDIEATLKKVAEEKFLDKKLTSNKKFVVQDASQFLKNTTEKYDLIVLDVYSNSYQVPEGFITAEFMMRLKSCVAENGVILMNVISSPSFSDKYTRVFDNTIHTVFTGNVSRQIIGWHNPWDKSAVSNVLYIYYNRPQDNRIYTINKTPVIYDRYQK